MYYLLSQNPFGHRVARCGFHIVRPCLRKDSDQDRSLIVSRSSQAISTCPVALPCKWYQLANLLRCMCSGDMKMYNNSVYLRPLAPRTKCTPSQQMCGYQTSHRLEYSPSPHKCLSLRSTFLSPVSSNHLENAPHPSAQVLQTLPPSSARLPWMTTCVTGCDLTEW